MKIKTKLWIMSAVCIAGAIFMGVESTVTTREINQISTDISYHWVPLVLSVEELNTMTSDFRVLQYDHIVALQKDDMGTLEEEMEALGKKIDAGFDEYETYVTESRVREMMEEARENWLSYLQLNQEMLSISHEGKIQEAQQKLEESRKYFVRFSELFLDVAEFHKIASQEASDRGDAIYMKMTQIKMMIILSMLTASILMVHVIVKSINRAVQEVSEGVWRFANGDLNVKLVDHSQDEIGVLTRSVNVLIDRVRHVVQDEKHMLQEIGRGHFEAESTCPLSYQGDFAPVLYIFDGLKTRLKETEELKKEVKALKKRLAELGQDNPEHSPQEKQEIKKPKRIEVKQLHGKK